MTQTCRVFSDVFEFKVTVKNGNRMGKEIYPYFHILMKRCSTMAFKFGADPEFFIITDSGGNVRADSVDFPTQTYDSHGNANEIKTDGDQSTAELSCPPFSDLDDMDAYFQQLVKTAWNRHMANKNPRDYSDTRGDQFHKWWFCFKPQDYNGFGGHIHVTSDDLTWWKSEQANKTLMFWICSVSILLCKSDLSRVSGPHHWGSFGDNHASPDPGNHEIDTAIQRGSVYWTGSPRILCWKGGWKGWEYRSPPTWLGPKNKDYRKSLWRAIQSVVKVQTPEGKALQEKFIDNFRKKLLGSASTRFSDDHSKLNQKIFYDPYTFANTLFEIEAEMPEYTDFKWFTDMLREASEIPLNLNPVDYYPAKEKVVERVFDTIQEAYGFMQKVWEAKKAPGQLMTFYEAGEKYAPTVGCKTVKVGVFDAIRGENVLEERDEFTTAIMNYSLGLAYYAFKAKHTRVKFDRVARSPITLLGAKDKHGSSSTMIFTPHDEFNNMPFVKQMLAAQGIGIGKWSPDAIGLKKKFRESETDVVYYILALYYLWKLEYIGRRED